MVQNLNENKLTLSGEQMKLLHSLSKVNYMQIYVCVLVSSTYFCARVAQNNVS